MDGIFWLVMLCAIAAATLFVRSLCRRMLSRELPDRLVSVAILEDAQALETRLDALAVQAAWTDSALVAAIWLVDVTPNGSLEAVCGAFCRTHPTFRYCRLTEIERIFAPGQ